MVTAKSTANSRLQVVSPLPELQREREPPPVGGGDLLVVGEDEFLPIQ